jgi:hypothetical protein
VASQIAARCRFLEKKQNHPFGEQMQERIPAKHCSFIHDATIIKEIKQ